MNTSFFQNVLDHIKLKEVEVVSFDFFDTLMSRKVPHPKDIFWILGKKIQAAQLFAFDITPERFQALRIQAEERARQEGSSREISIVDIYSQFPSGFFTHSIDEIIALEIQTESDFLFPVIEMKEAMELAHRRGKKIIIVSDIYLSKQHLETFWAHHTPAIKIDYFVSSEHKTGKSEKLFDHVIKKLKKPAGSILHIGDNYISDVQTPAIKGMKSCFIPHGSSTFWNIYNLEQAASAPSEARFDPSSGDLAITTLRCKAMLHSSPTQADNVSFMQYGTQVLGPVIAPFIHWVRSASIASDVDIVMPLMREGHMIHKLISSYSDIVSQPAYLSRRVLFQAGLIHADRDILSSLRFGNLEASINDYLELIGLYANDVPNLQGKTSTSLNDDKIFDDLLDEITTSPTLISSIRARAMSIRQGVVSHFKTLIQRNGSLPKKVALVDVGWNGTIQKLLARILEEEKIDVSLIGLYMMTTPTVNDLAFQGILAKGFYVDGGAPHADFLSLSRTLEIFEQCCSPAHGSVLRHDIRTGEPVLKPDLIPSNQRTDIEDVQEGIILFHELYRKYVQADLSVGVLSAIGEKIRPILRRAMLAPTQQEALLFSSWMHDDNLASGAVMPIMGTEQSQTFARYKTIRQHMNTPMNELYWPSGALAINDTARIRALSISAIHQLPTDEFDTDLALSSEIAVDRAVDGQHLHSFETKNHQHVYQNSSGLTYLKFEVMADPNSVLRWTPIAKPFDLHVAFIIFSFIGATGIKTSYRIDGETALSSRSIPFGMDHYDNSSWRGPGFGCAFYFRDLRSFGIMDEGKLTVEIACRINTLDQVPQKDIGSREFTISKNAILKSGHSLIEIFNNAPLSDQTVLQSTSNEISLSGWMIDPDFTKPRGKFYMRVTNSIGETHFIPMSTIRRPDLAKEMKKEQDFGHHVEFGFALKNYKLPAGRYTATVLRKDQDTYLVGKDSWQLSIDGGR